MDTLALIGSFPSLQAERNHKFSNFIPHPMKFYILSDHEAIHMILVHVSFIPRKKSCPARYSQLKEIIISKLASVR